MSGALDVASWFYKNNNQVRTISKTGNVVAQKLCYYAQAMCLAVLNRPLFDEKIEAWKEGPVINDVYIKYRWYTPILSRFNKDKINKDEELILQVVNSVYGYKTAEELTSITHLEMPWKQYEDVACDKDNNPEISIEFIKSYYKNLKEVFEANKSNDFENESFCCVGKCNFAYNKRDIADISKYSSRLREISREQTASKSFNLILDEFGELVIYE